MNVLLHSMEEKGQQTEGMPENSQEESKLLTFSMTFETKEIHPLEINE